MNKKRFIPAARCLSWSLLVVAFAGTAPGCLGMRLRDRIRANEGSFSEAPSLPKTDFGREKSGMQQTGTDRRAREIEASLGVGD